MRRFLFLGLVFCSIPLVGCASKSGKNSLQTNGSSGLSHSETPAPFNDARYQKLVKEIEDSGGTTQMPDESESALSKIGSSVKKATGSVASALTLKPKVIKAADPVSLDNMPNEIHADVFYQAGRLAESKGNQKAAAEQYRRALETDPKHLPSLISLARLHDRSDEFTQAQQLYLRAVKVAPQSATAYNDLGLCLARDKQPQEGVAALRQAISLEPNSKLYRNNLATLLIDLGQVNEAWNTLLGAHSPAVAHYNVGVLLHEKGDLIQARRQFELALQKDATLVVAKEMLATLETQTVAKATDDKVRYRVEDEAAAQSVSMVVSPRELRRIPPTSQTAPLPAVRQRDAAPGPILGPPAQPYPQGSTRSPKTSSNMVREQIDGDLPTPSLLGEVAQR